MPTDGSQSPPIVKRIGDMVKVGSDPLKPYRKLTSQEKRYVDNYKRE